MIAKLFFISLPLIVSTKLFTYGMVFDHDSRTSLSSLTNVEHQKWGKSVGIILNTNEILTKVRDMRYKKEKKYLEDSNILAAFDLDENHPDFPICESEKFYGEPSVESCSSFFIGDKYVMTAAHCIKGFITKKICEDNISVVFNYHDLKNTKDTLVKKKDTYKCKNIIFHSYAFTENSELANDIAIIELDRDVVGIKPLKLAASAPSENTSIIALGFPLGLSVKRSGPAQVIDNSNNRVQDALKLYKKVNENSFFMANLDSFSGYSGSPVIDANTGEVYGVAQTFYGSVEGTVEGDPEQNYCHRIKACKTQSDGSCIKTTKKDALNPILEANTSHEDDNHDDKFKVTKYLPTTAGLIPNSVKAFLAFDNVTQETFKNLYVEFINYEDYPKTTRKLETNNPEYNSLTPNAKILISKLYKNFENYKKKKILEKKKRKAARKAREKAREAREKAKKLAEEKKKEIKYIKQITYFNQFICLDKDNSKLSCSVYNSGKGIETTDSKKRIDSDFLYGEDFFITLDLDFKNKTAFWKKGDYFKTKKIDKSQYFTDFFATYSPGALPTEKDKNLINQTFSFPLYKQQTKASTLREMYKYQIYEDKLDFESKKKMSISSSKISASNINCKYYPKRKFISCYEVVRLDYILKPIKTNLVSFPNAHAGICVIPTQNNEVVLISHGKDTLNNKTRITFPGGLRRFGETVKEAAKRQTLDETGYTVIVKELLHSKEKLFEKGKVTYFFKCEINQSTPKVEPKDTYEVKEVILFNLINAHTNPDYKNKYSWEYKEDAKLVYEFLGLKKYSSL